jgi:CMP-N-acetylneuraminic acid synthetase
MRIGAIIPCKKGSVGVPDKNFKRLCGKVMWMWTLNAAANSQLFDLVVVSSNGGLKYSGIQGKLYLNNEEVIPDIDVSSLDALCKMYAEQFPDIDVWCLLQPTSPLRTYEDIIGTFDKMDNCDSVFTVTSVGDKYWSFDGMKPKAFYNPMDRLMRQNPMTNVLYYENGAIYFFTREQIMSGSRIGGRIGMYQMPQERSVQIDSPVDWKLCELLLRERKECKK